MHILGQQRVGSKRPLDAGSIRLLVAATVGVLIWLIWVTGMIGDSHRVTALALSAVSLLGLGLVLELRFRYTVEAKLQESERHYRLLADHSFDMIARLDPETWRRTYVSPACRHLYGFEPNELVGRPVDNTIYDDDVSRVRQAIGRVQRGAEEAPVLYRARRKDGDYIWVEASMRLSTDPATGAAEIVCVVRDASERMRYESELRQAKEQADSANQSKSLFLATMSHELRTPLNAVIGFSEFIQAEPMGPIDKHYRSYIDDIHDSGTHLLQLVNDILDLTKAEAGMLELHEEVIEVEAVVNSITRLCRSSIDKAGLTVIIELQPNLPYLRADQRKVRQVLFNLIGNAVKFTPEGGHITVSGQFDPQAGIEIAVTDTGIGIAQEDLNRVLQPYVQLDNTMSRLHTGTGLGLPAVKALMELHDGRLELTSALGAGTRAAACFPLFRAVEDRDAFLAMADRDRG